MHKTKNELYSLISDLKTKKEFEKEIKQRFIADDGLFNEDALALFLVDELGRNTQTITPLSQLEANKEYVVVGTITSIAEVKVFRRKDGTAGKVLNLEISDTSSTCRLVLWNDEIELVKNKDLQSGTKIRIINGYTKQGYSGVELHLGKWGLLDVEPTETCGNGDVLQQPTNVITGVLIKKEPT